MIDFSQIRCVVFDYAFTLSSDLYFQAAPPQCPQWRSLIQRHIFDCPPIVQQWMKAELSVADIAARLSPHVGMDIASIVAQMKKGCEGLAFNQAVLNFAIAQKRAGRKTALVTANMDVFSEVVVPAHGLDRRFDVILNSADYREIRKEYLWPIAFEQLGPGITYANSLLIEDGPENPAKFRQRGGLAYQYRDDEMFLEWLQSVGWQ